MKTKRLLSGVMSVVMIFTMFFAMTLVVNTAAPMKASAATTTEKAIFIGSNTKTITAAFIPLNITPSSTTWYKLSFKCKMLQNGRSTAQAGKPSIGIVGQAASDYSTNYAVGTCPSWAGAYATESTDCDDYNYNADLTSGVYSMYFKLDGGTWNKSADKYSQGNRSFYLTVGNAAYRNFSSHVAFDNMGCSFIFSDVSLYQAASQGGATSGDNLIPQINDSNVDFGGTYYLLGDGNSDSTVADSLLAASANKWHVVAMPDHVKYITVPSDYNTSSNYNSANFSQTAATDYTREYYTNSNYSDLTFGKLANSGDAGFEVISSDVNKKMIVIDANHEGEADNRTTDGYKPVYNRPANIFIPLSLGQYNISKYGKAASTNYIVKVSFTATRLEGSGYPVLGRIYTLDSTHSQAYGKSVKNVNLSGYYADGSHEIGNACTYDASTGAFVGWVYMTANASNRKSIYGISEILTIGNAEHVWQEGTFDTTEFNTSFAISNIKVDLYSNAGSYTAGSLVAEDIAPALYADTIDTDTRWAYQCSGSNSYSSHARDVARAGQTTWNAEGCVGMVHTVDLTACMKGNHVGNMTHHAATDTTREYWGCSTCRKSYADPYGLEEITDTSASKQMAILQASGSGTETLVYPVKLNTFEGNQWFKFTCKVKCFGDSTPVVSTLYSVYDGVNQCETTVTSSNDGDFAVWETSYDASTGILTAYIKAWIKDSINKGSRYPFERINPVSGANCAIVVGNGRYAGTGFADDNHTTGFAITEPALYKISGATTGGSSGLADAKTKSTTGDNFVNPITSATVDFTSSYSTSWAASDNPLSAPIGKWYKIGSKKNWIKASNIPAGFYEGTATSKMIELRGLADNSNARYFFQKQLFLDSEKAYTLEFDYRSFSGYDPYVSINYHTGGSWTALTRTSESFTGSHATITFTTPEGLRTSGDGNFLLRLGLPYESKASSSAYFTNVKVTSTSTGNNSLIYGDFSLSDAGTLTAGNTDTVMYGWENASALVLGYSSVKVMSIPSGFFTGNDISGDTTIALKVQGQNYIEPQFKVRLKAGTYYKFSYDYRSIDDAPEFFVRDDDVDKPTLISSNSGGKYRMTYQVYNSGAEDYSRFCFSYGAYSSSKTMYIGNLQLYELTGEGGSIVGPNIIGNMNAILDSSVYSGITSSGTNVTLTQDDATNITRDLANGWFVAIPSSVYTNDAQVVKVSSDFFNYKTPAQRQELIRKVVLGQASTNATDPHYDPNNDSTRSDVKDLVHSKITTVFHNGNTENVSDSMVETMFETIMNPNDSSGYVAGGNSWYVSDSEGNDSNSGTSAGSPVKTISKANSKASAGDTIYLKRGDTWRNTDLTVDASFTLKSGVHYAAYGSGAKPELLGSAKNYGGSSNSSGWTETSSGSHVWYYQYISSGSATTNSNAGMIYFIDADGTVHPGKSIASPNTNNNTYSYSAGDLDSDLEYFAPNKSGSNTITAGSYSTQGRIYVYSNTNPATRFPRIEIAPRHTVVEGNNGTSSSEAGVTTLNNVAVKYGGYHGIKSISGGSNFWINKCEIAYIGGGVQFTSDGSNRIGNGIEFGNGFTNGRVYDCYVHDCFDAGVTFQSYGTGSAVSFNNIYFCRNVIENCTYNIEFFLNRNDSDSMSNIYIEDNILRNAGYGWGCYDRADGGFRTGNIAASKNSYINNVSSTYIRNNIFDCTRLAHVMWTWGGSPDRHAGLTATGNTYIQRKGAQDWCAMAYGPIGGGFQYASDRASLATAVSAFDTAPNAIIWLGDIG